jgi:signal transduction histidine kinase
MMLLVGIPVRYDTLMQVCEDVGCARRTLNTEDLSVLHENGWTQQGYAVFQIAAELIYLVFMSPLALLLIRRTTSPHGRMGYLTAYVLLSLATVLMPEITLNLAQSHAGWYLLYQVLKGLSWIAFFYFLFTFPNGIFTPGWLRWLLLIPASVVLLWLITGDMVWDSAEAYGIVASVGLLWVGVIAQFYRYRWRASREERQQTKWLLFGLLLVIIVNLIWVIAFQALQIQSAAVRILFNTLGYLVLTTGPVSIAVALTLAVLRYRLWDIDLLINRTLVYTILTAVIALIYIALVNLVGSLLDNTLPVSLLATGVIAVSFQGLRERIQRSINRFMFGQRDEPQTVLFHLSKQLQTAILPQELLDASVNTVASTLKIPYVAITIRRGTDQIMQTEYGTNKTATQSFALVYQNEGVGELVIGLRSPGEPLNRADYVVLGGIAQQLGAVVYAVRLQSDLQAARERLVITREEERRRLRRDLHDGLGPALASLPLKVDAAIDLMEDDRSTSVRLLGEVKRQAQQLVGDVRQVVHDLRPPALDELGLVEAARGAVSHLHSPSSALHIRLDADGVPRQLPAAVEAAGYRIIMEAVTNVVKHADARQCTIRLEMLDKPPCLQLTVEDDGSGLSEQVRANVGLRSMRERAEELGGTFEILSRTMGGTRVKVSLPLERGVLGHE